MTGRTERPLTRGLIMTRISTTVLSAALLCGGLLTVSAPAEAAPTCDGLRVTIKGTAGNDRLVGTRRADVIAGVGGNDTIEGNGGNDHVCGGPGNDLITGAEGNDRLRGQGGADTIDGGPGNELIVGGGGNDILFGAGGDDSIAGNAGDDHLESGPNTTSALLYGQGGDDVLVAQGAGSILYGDDGEDTLRVLDTTERAKLVGGADDDDLVGGPAGDLLLGETGNDTLDGAGGGDAVVAGAGSDSMLGGPGDDALKGEAGSDTCDGEAGNDVCHGGSPGTDANTPDDPDVCSAEVIISCRKAAAPQHWLVHVIGTTWWRPAPGAHEERTDWDVTSQLDLTFDNKGNRHYVENGATGQWEVTGFNNDCSISGSDTYQDGDFDYSLDTHGEQTYDFDINGLYAAYATWSCPGSEDVERTTHVDAKEMVIGLPYAPDPSDGTLRGTRTVVGDHSNTTTYTWVLTPVTN